MKQKPSNMCSFRNTCSLVMCILFYNSWPTESFFTNQQFVRCIGTKSFAFSSICNSREDGRKKTFGLHSSIDSADGTTSGDDSFMEKNPSPMDFRLFLTQRCLQSFMFLVLSMKDPHTIKWLDDFTQPIIQLDPVSELDRNLAFGKDSSYVANDQKLNSKLCQYHGLNAFNTTKFPTWDSYFFQLLEQPPTTLKIASHNNPRVPEFDIDIEPSRLCARIISVREQIAKEWIQDLGVIEKMGYDKFYSYWENLKKEKKDGETNSITDPPNLIFLEWDPNEDSDFAPSPLRKSSFDLLIKLTTQESIHRILEMGISVEGDVEGKESTQFLRSFYNEKLDTHFLGMHRYGRGDDFIDELMNSSTRMISKKDGKVVIVNPVTIAEIVLKMRDKVAAEWMEIAKISSDEHFEIRKLMLDKMMGK